MVDFLFALIELFSLSLLRFRSYEVKCVHLAVFVRRPYRVVPINRSCHRKTRETGLPVDEERIPLYVTSFKHIIGVWRTADGQTDGFAVAYTAFAKLCFVVWWASDICIWLRCNLQTVAQRSVEWRSNVTRVTVIMRGIQFCRVLTNQSTVVVRHYGSWLQVLAFYSMVIGQ